MKFSQNHIKIGSLIYNKDFPREEHEPVHLFTKIFYFKTSVISSNISFES